MSVSPERINVLYDKYTTRYQTNPLLGKQVFYCGIGNIRVGQEFSRTKVSLKKGESLDDYCICTTLKEQPPARVKLEPFFEEVRVFYKVMDRKLSG